MLHNFKVHLCTCAVICLISCAKKEINFDDFSLASSSGKTSSICMLPAFTVQRAQKKQHFPSRLLNWHLRGKVPAAVKVGSQIPLDGQPPQGRLQLYNKQRRAPF